MKNEVSLITHEVLIKSKRGVDVSIENSSAVSLSRFIGLEPVIKEETSKNT